MSTQGGPVKEYVVRVPKNSRKKYHMMRFHTASGVDFKHWTTVRMERENNFKEYKHADDDLPKFGAGSEFGREQREEARRKRYGINVKKYKPDDQPWLLVVKERVPPKGGVATPHNTNSGPTVDKRFKGIREGGISDNAAWYVFLQAKDGAFEAYPVEEWYNFQPINRYKALNAEEAEKEFERRDKIMNFFSVMVSKKLRPDEDDADAGEEGGGGGKKGEKGKNLLLMGDDWMSDKDSDDDDDGSDEDGVEKKKVKPVKKFGQARKKRKQGGKTRKREDGESGTDCEEESDDFDEGAEHEYESDDSSDPEVNADEVLAKDLTGVEEGKALKKLLHSDDEDDEEDEENKIKLKEEERQKELKEEEERKKKKKLNDSDPDLSDSSDDEKQAKSKDAKKNGSAPAERNADVLKRKLADSGDGTLSGNSKRMRPTPDSASAVQHPPVLPSDSGMFEDQIRRYLLRKPMTTTEILQKLKSKKTGHTSEQLVNVIAVMLKKINPQKQRVKGKMYLSLKLGQTG